MMEALKVFTAFSGYDSQCLALKRLGIDFELIGWSEIDKYAIQAHDVLFPEYKGRNYGDISKIDWSDIPDFDLLTYSFTCTCISTAGKQEGFEEGSGTSSSLLWECRKAIVAKKPKYLLMENVKALLSNKFKPLFCKWMNELSSYGYTNFIKVLDAQSFGIPQHRERVFMVSILGENASFHFPEPFPLEKKLKDVLESNVDEKYYLSEKLINYVFSNGGKDKNIKGGVGVCDKTDNVSPTLTAQYYKSSRQAAYLIEPKFGDSRLNKMLKEKEIPTDEPVCIDSYNQSVIKGVFCTIRANIGTENMKYVTEPLSCAMRGRDLDNPSNREPGCTTGQRLEIGDDKANTITTVQKDNLLFEPQQVIGSAQKNAYVGYVDGIAPTINAACGMGGGQTPMILGVTVNPGRKREFENGHIRQDTCHTLTAQDSKNTSVVWERNKHINYKITKNGKIRAYTDDERKSGVSELQIDNEDAISSTVTTAHIPKCYGESMGFRIRKLTPREVFRLMDVDDEDIDKLLASGISNTRLYCMAGNSICTSVLYHIFRKLFIEKENENQQLTLF